MKPVYSEQELRQINARINSIPVGGNRKFLVTCNSQPCAGFDTLDEANEYMAMQRNSRKGKKSTTKEDKASDASRTAAGKMTWEVRRQG